MSWTGSLNDSLSKIILKHLWRVGSVDYSGYNRVEKPPDAFVCDFTPTSCGVPRTLFLGTEHSSDPYVREFESVMGRLVREMAATPSLIPMGANLCTESYPRDSQGITTTTT